MYLRALHVPALTRLYIERGTGWGEKRELGLVFTPGIKNPFAVERAWKGLARRELEEHHPLRLFGTALHDFSRCVYTSRWMWWSTMAKYKYRWGTRGRCRKWTGDKGVAKDRIAISFTLGFSFTLQRVHLPSGRTLRRGWTNLPFPPPTHQKKMGWKIAQSYGKLLATDQRGGRESMRKTCKMLNARGNVHGATFRNTIKRSAADRDFKFSLNLR